MKNISQEKVLGMSIPMPDIRSQRKYAETFKSIWSLNQNISQAFKRGEMFFQSLQQRAFTGELFTEKETPSQPPLFEVSQYV